MVRNVLVLPIQIDLGFKLLPVMVPLKYYRYCRHYRLLPGGWFGQMAVEVVGYE